MQTAPTLHSILRAFLPEQTSLPLQAVNMLMAEVQHHIYDHHVGNKAPQQFDATLKQLQMLKDMVVVGRVDRGLYLPFLGKVTTCRTSVSLPVASCHGVDLFIDGAEHELLCNAFGMPAWRVRRVVPTSALCGYDRVISISRVMTCVGMIDRNGLACGADDTCFWIRVLKLASHQMSFELCLLGMSMSVIKAMDSEEACNMEMKMRMSSINFSFRASDAFMAPSRTLTVDIMLWSLVPAQESVGSLNVELVRKMVPEEKPNPACDARGKGSGKSKGKKRGGKLRRSDGSIVYVRISYRANSCIIAL